MGGGCLANAIIHGLDAPVYPSRATNVPLLRNSLHANRELHPIMIDALAEERLTYFAKVVQRNPRKSAFLNGWSVRLHLYWIHAKTITGKANEAARWLNGQPEKFISDCLARMSREEAAALHEAARNAAGVGPDSNLAKMTRYSYLAHNYQLAQAAKDKARMAFFLNASTRPTLKLF
jgi:hypothetical protein